MCSFLVIAKQHVVHSVGAAKLGALGEFVPGW
jgi:hypothetical protein